jgi:DNA-binding PadR family transcriptional regulator
LTLLAEQPRNGYQIIQEIADRSGGAWRPSPGAVYPALQQLTDEGLVRVEESEGRRTYHLTDAGRAYVDDQLRAESAPWEEAMRPPFHEDVHDLFHLAAADDAGRQAVEAQCPIATETLHSLKAADAGRYGRKPFEGQTTRP